MNVGWDVQHGCPVGVRGLKIKTKKADGVYWLEVRKSEVRWYFTKMEGKVTNCLSWLVIVVRVWFTAARQWVLWTQFQLKYFVCVESVAQCRVNHLALVNQRQNCAEIRLPDACFWILHLPEGCCDCNYEPLAKGLFRSILTAIYD